VTGCPSGSPLDSDLDQRHHTPATTGTATGTIIGQVSCWARVIAGQHRHRTQAPPPPGGPASATPAPPPPAKTTNTTRVEKNDGTNHLTRHSRDSVRQKDVHHRTDHQRGVSFRPPLNRPPATRRAVLAGAGSRVGPPGVLEELEPPPAPGAARSEPGRRPRPRAGRTRHPGGPGVPGPTPTRMPPLRSARGNARTDHHRQQHNLPAISGRRVHHHRRRRCRRSVVATGQEDRPAAECARREAEDAVLALTGQAPGAGCGSSSSSTPGRPTRLARPGENGPSRSRRAIQGWPE